MNIVDHLIDCAEFVDENSLFIPGSALDLRVMCRGAVMIDAGGSAVDGESGQVKFARDIGKILPECLSETVSEREYAPLPVMGSAPGAKDQRNAFILRQRVRVLTFGQLEFAPAGTDIERITEFAPVTVKDLLAALVKLCTGEFPVVEIDACRQLPETDGKRFDQRFIVPEFRSSVTVAGTFVGGVGPVQRGEFAPFILPVRTARPGAVLTVRAADVAVAHSCKGAPVFRKRVIESLDDVFFRAETDWHNSACKENLDTFPRLQNHPPGKGEFRPSVFKRPIDRSVVGGAFKLALSENHRVIRIDQCRSGERLEQSAAQVFGGPPFESAPCNLLFPGRHDIESPPESAFLCGWDVQRNPEFQQTLSAGGVDNFPLQRVQIVCFAETDFPFKSVSPENRMPVFHRAGQGKAFCATPFQNIECSTQIPFTGGKRKSGGITREFKRVFLGGSSSRKQSQKQQ